VSQSSDSIEPLALVFCSLIYFEDSRKSLKMPKG